MSVVVVLHGQEHYLGYHPPYSIGKGIYDQVIHPQLDMTETED